jgi:hypothetical protein
MKAEIGTEAALFPKKEYLNGFSLQCVFYPVPRNKIIPSNAHISTPFFQKTVFFCRIFFGKPPLKIFGGMSKFGIYLIMKFSLQF